MVTINFAKWGPLTVLTVVAVLIVLVAGAVATIVSPSTLSFNDYINDLKVVATGLGVGTAIGRGIHLASK